MATIKFRRGSSDPTTAIAPSGLTIGEPVYNTSANKFFVHNGTTGIWVGAQIEHTVADWTSATKLATQGAIKTYVEGVVASQGAGFTVAASSGTAQVILPGTDTLTIAAGSGISTTAGATDTITIANTGVTGAVAGTGISVSSATGNVTITNDGVRSLTLGASANGGLAVSGAGTTGALTKDISISFANLPSLGASVATGDLLIVGDVSDTDNTKDTTVGNVLDIINGDVNVDSSGSSSIATGAIVDADINNSAAITVTKLAAYTISGHTLGNNLSTLTIGNGLGGTSYNGSAPITITNTGVTGIAAGTGISVSSATGNVTITNNGVQSLAGTSNQISISPAGGTGAVTLSLPSAITTPGSLTTTGNLTVGGDLTVNGTTTTVNSTTLSVEDSLIKLAKGNSAANTLDIGLYGLYDPTGSQDTYAGLFRDATDGKWRLFTGLQTEPTTTVDTGGAGYSVGTLVASLEGTATNATNVAMLSDTSDTTCFLSFVNAASDTNQALKYNSGLGYNASTNALTATTFVGALSGNASTATNATNATNVIATEQTTGTYYLVGMGAAGTTGSLLIDATATIPLSYNVATATLTCAMVEAIVDGGAY